MFFSWIIYEGESLEMQEIVSTVFQQVVADIESFHMAVSDGFNIIYK